MLLSAIYQQEMPYLEGGPLLAKYEFSQIHFHWGPNPMEGSEHTVDGSHLPLEMHVIHYKKCYLTHELALNEKDGIVTLVYFFKVHSYTYISILFPMCCNL